MADRNAFPSFYYHWSLWIIESSSLQMAFTFFIYIRSFTHSFFFISPSVIAHDVAHFNRQPWGTLFFCMPFLSSLYKICFPEKKLTSQGPSLFLLLLNVKLGRVISRARSIVYTVIVTKLIWISHKAQNSREVANGASWGFPGKLEWYTGVPLAISSGPLSTLFTMVTTKVLSGKMSHGL